LDSWPSVIRFWILRLLRKDTIHRWRSMGAHIGNRVFIGREAIIDKSFASWLTIEDDVVISAHCTILCHDSALNNIYGLPVKVGHVTIEKGVYIGAHCIILCGVTIGAQALVGAGSLVTSDLPAGMVAFGSPAKVQGSIIEYRQRFEKEMHDGSRFQYLNVRPWRERQKELNSNEIRSLLSGQK
jgi:acetyltransferase-like isoleucine patch superfamily enzyme